jgi:hypothetical protein
MTVLPETKQSVRRFKFYLASQSAYRGCLMTASSWKAEKALHALLWGVAGLIMIVSYQPLQTARLDRTSNVFKKPSQRLPVNSSAVKSSSDLVQNKNVSQSIFQLAKQLPEAATGVEPDHVLTEKLIPQKRVAKQLRMQLQIQQAVISEAEILNSLAYANQSIQSGQLESAKEVLQEILRQDPHQVEALEGMLMISRKVADPSREEEYLERIRQEIPEYERTSFISVQEYREP